MQKISREKITNSDNFSSKHQKNNSKNKNKNHGKNNNFKMLDFFIKLRI